MMVSSLETELEFLDFRSRLRHFTRMKGRLLVASLIPLSEDEAETSRSSILAAARVGPVGKSTIEAQAGLVRTVQLGRRAQGVFVHQTINKAGSP